MAATIVTSGMGVLLKRGDGATPTEAFTAIAEVTGISGPSLSRETIDATHMESPNETREFIKGLKDSGEIQVDLNFLPGNTNQKGLIADWVSGVVRNFKLVWSDTGASTWAFAGIVTGFEPNAAIDDKLSASATIKVSGAITFPT